MAYTTLKSDDSLSSCILPQDACSLVIIPALPSSSDRYQRNFEVKPHDFVLPATYSMTPDALPAGWQQHIHPEGLPYYQHTDLRLITDNNIHHPGTLAFLMAARDSLGSMAAQSAREWQDVDFVIRVDLDSRECTYYLLEHHNWSVWWLHETASVNLGLPDVASTTQTSHLLREEYWIHVEFFPHYAFNLPIAIAQLENDLEYGYGDQMTSQNSTFPYDKKTCKESLKFLRTRRSLSVSVTWFAARFLSIISRHRYDTFFGEEHARMCREQRRLSYTPPKTDFLMKALSGFVFNASDSIATELEQLQIDEIVYTMHWRKFIGARMAGWQECSQLSTLLLLLSFGGSLLARSDYPRALGLVAAVFAFGSLISGTALRYRYSNGEDLQAGDVHEHLHNLEHPTYGHRVAAAMFALPRAFQTWSVLMFSAQLVLSALDILDPMLVIIISAASIFVGAMLCAMASILSRQASQPPGGGGGDTGPLAVLLRLCCLPFGSRQRQTKEDSLA